MDILNFLLLPVPLLDGFAPVWMSPLFHFHYWNQRWCASACPLDDHPRVVIKSITFKTTSHLLPQVYFPPYFFSSEYRHHPKIETSPFLFAVDHQVPSVGPSCYFKNIFPQSLPWFWLKTSQRLSILVPLFVPFDLLFSPCPEPFAPNISWQTSSVKSQRINILGFASHI